MLLVMGCVATAPLRTKPLEKLPKDDGHQYTLIYYLGTDPEDSRRAIIMDLEDDDYTFLPEVRDFEYEILQDLPVGEGVYEAVVFFRNEKVFVDFVAESILSPEGKHIGYEFRPLYSPEIYPDKDVLKLTYLIDLDKKITIDIRFKETALKTLIKKY